MPKPFLSACRWLVPTLLMTLLLTAVVWQASNDDPMTRQQQMAQDESAAGWATDDAVATGDPSVAIAAFDAWSQGLDSRAWTAEEVQEGVQLAKARRSALKALIVSNPREALAHAVPYEMRKLLADPIKTWLEIPVSTTADFELEQACGGPDGRSWRERWVMLDGERQQVFTFGERAEVATKQKLSVHGISIDALVAMADDPVRELGAAETADLGLQGRTIQVGKRFYQVESDAALAEARQQLRQSEQELGPLKLPAYRELALGQVEGVWPVAAQDGTGDGADLPPEQPSAHTEGAKTMLYIRARFADEDPAYEPVALATAQARQGEAEAFWEENSYGKSTLTTTFTDVVTLPKNGGDYVGAFGTLHSDARAAALAANSAWNYNNFDFYTVITNTATNSQGTGFGYAGVASVGGKPSHLLRQYIAVRTSSHEFGHNLGLYHSGYWLTDSPSPNGEDSKPGGYVGDAADDERIEYGHKFGVMGAQNGSGDFDSGRAHYTASNKNRLDWLVQADGDIVSTTTGGTFQLYRHDVQTANFGSMTDAVPRAIKINVNSTTPPGISSPYKYWLTYRLLPTNGIAENWLPYGIQVDWRRDTGGQNAVQLDMTPYSRDTGPYGANPGTNTDNNDKEDGILQIGRTFSDVGADIHFTATGKGGTEPNQYLDVVVNVGTQASNDAPVITAFTVSNTTPNIGQTVSFSVSATDPNGDALAYHWDMGDNTNQNGQLNLPTRTKNWSNAGFYVARVEVSDMKGGKATESVVI
ncbi:MAG: PKD domain-containing protein, partial [Verrucomicrobiales bacterium]|nr:PKD domain-containing protein [Verrucomicrobiales bacterium]